MASPGDLDGRGAERVYVAARADEERVGERPQGEGGGVAEQAVH